jgi:ribosomal protein L20A (L18A)
MEKLYVVYGENNFVYIVKANNKKQAIELAYSSYGLGERKTQFVAKDLEKEIFHEKGSDRTVAMLI